MAEERLDCILCGERAVRLFLDLGKSALANAFVAETNLAEAEKRQPLRVGFCGVCSHVQLLDLVPPTEIFSNYLYVSSTSDTLVAHLTGLAKTVVERCMLDADDLIIDVGCNDGTLLSGFIGAGQRNLLGVDPAVNLAPHVRVKGAQVISGFFGLDTIDEVLSHHGQAAVISMTNTFPHIPDLDGLMRSVDRVLRPDGTLIIEAHYLMDLLDQGAYDTVYHEHVSYWALRPMQRLFRAYGFEAVAVERLPIHHGQLRVFVRRSGQETPDASVQSLEEVELESGLANFETFKSFAGRVIANKSGLKDLVSDLRAQGHQVVGYGAPAKGNTLLGFLELGPRDIDYICDRSPLKQGRYTPGTHIPVVSPKRLVQDQPDYTVLFAWNFVDEIVEQQRDYLENGGKFIVPIPEVRTISA